MSKPDFERLYNVQVENLEEYALFLIDESGAITSWNAGVQKILQYSREEFVGKRFAEIFTPEDRSAGAPETEMSTAARQGRSGDIRWHLRKDGSRVFVEGVLCGIREDGRLAGYSKVMRDATARHEAEEALRRSEAFARSIVESSPDCIKVLDLEGHIQSINGSGCCALELDDFEVWRNRSWLDLWNDADKAAARKALEMARSGTQATFEGDCTTAKGNSKSWEAVVAPIVNAEGKPARLLSILRDISERREAARLLQRSHDNLAEFAHVVSHDLQAPLRTMRSYAQLLSKRYTGRLDEAADAFLAFIVQGSQNMEELIRGLLRYAEFGDKEEREIVSLSGAVDVALPALKGIIDETEATIACSPLPEIRTNPTQIQQLFQNLIGNALKYRSNDPPRIEIDAELREGWWVICVRDNGVGIPPEYHEQIFQPLKRLHGQEIAGTGLGLAVCKRIVERNGGRIWVESAPGAGARFYFSLPADLDQ